MAVKALTGARLWLSRVLWMVAIWSASVAALASAAMIMRILMQNAGLSI